MVPMLQCGLVRSNFALAIHIHPCRLRTCAAFQNRGWLLRKTALFKPEILGQSSAHHAG
jgi:hypothetical protein